MRAKPGGRRPAVPTCEATLSQREPPQQEPGAQVANCYRRRTSRECLNAGLPQAFSDAGRVQIAAFDEAPPTRSSRRRYRSMAPIKPLKSADSLDVF